MNHAAPMSSKVANCDDEDEYNWLDSNGNNFYIFCLSELKARGWDKYIPAKLPDEKLSAGKLFPNYKKSTTSIITSIAEVVDFSYACIM